jgi:hypothetical protein
LRAFVDDDVVVVVVVVVVVAVIIGSRDSRPAGVSEVRTACLNSAGLSGTGIDSFFNCFPPKNRPSWSPIVPIHHRCLTNHMLTVPMIERLLCSLVGELDQTKLGMHPLDVE